MRARSGSSNSSSGSSGRCAGAMALVLPPRSLPRSPAAAWPRRLRLRLRRGAGGAPRAWRSAAPPLRAAPAVDRGRRETRRRRQWPRRGTEAGTVHCARRSPGFPGRGGSPRLCPRWSVLEGRGRPLPPRPGPSKPQPGPRPGQNRADSAADPQGPALASRIGKGTPKALRGGPFVAPPRADCSEGLVCAAPGISVLKRLRQED